MSTLNDQFKQSELAMAAYADFVTGTINANDLANSNAEMSIAQAQHFAEIWAVLNS